jgi:hypothetical protein
VPFSPWDSSRPILGPAKGDFGREVVGHTRPPTNRNAALRLEGEVVDAASWRYSGATVVKTSEIASREEGTGKVPGNKPQVWWVRFGLCSHLQGKNVHFWHHIWRQVCRPFFVSLQVEMVERVSGLFTGPKARLVTLFRLQMHLPMALDA